MNNLKNKRDLYSEIYKISNQFFLEKQKRDEKINDYIVGTKNKAQKLIRNAEEVGELIEDLKLYTAEINLLLQPINKNDGEYKQIWTISNVHKNIIIIKAVARSFQDLKIRAKRVSELINIDNNYKIPENLLLIYHYICEIDYTYTNIVEIFKDEHDKKEIWDDMKFINEVIEDFERYFWRNVSCFFIYIRSLSFKAIWNIVKVLEVAQHLYQQSLWIKSSKIEQIEKIRKFYNLGPSKSFNYSIIYKEKVFQSLERQIKDYIKSKMKDNQTLNENVNFVRNYLIPQLVNIRDKIVPFFKEISENSLQFFVIEYHKSIVEEMEIAIKKDLTPNGIFLLLIFELEYVLTLERDFYVLYSKITPKLIESKLKLQKKYVKCCTDSVISWIKNLVDGISKMIEDEILPDKDSAGKYMNLPSGTLFNVIGEIIYQAESARDAELLFLLSESMAKAIAILRKEIFKMLTKYYRKFRKSQKVDELVYNIIMIVNESTKWMKSTNEILQKIYINLLQKDKERIALIFKEIEASFLGIYDDCLGLIEDVIFKTIKPAMEKLFTDSWYNPQTSPIDTIMITFDDYFQDFQQIMIDKIFLDLLKRVFIKYLSFYKFDMAKKAIVFNENLDLLKDSFEYDQKITFGCFQKYLPTNYITEKYDQITYSYLIICTKKKSLPIALHNFKAFCSESENFSLSNLLKRRPDHYKDFIVGIYSLYNAGKALLFKDK